MIAYYCYMKWEQGKHVLLLELSNKYVGKEHRGFTGALYLASGQGLLDKFKNELIFKCTGGHYIPEDYKNLTSWRDKHIVKIR